MNRLDISTIIKPVRIGEAAKALGVSISTLRRWEESGKISALRTPGGTRLYSIEELKKAIKTKKYQRAERALGRGIETVTQLLQEHKKPTDIINDNTKEVEQIIQKKFEEKHESPSYVILEDDHSSNSDNDPKNKSSHNWGFLVITLVLLLSLFPVLLLGDHFTQGGIRKIATQINLIKTENLPKLAINSLDSTDKGQSNQQSGSVLAEETVSRYLEINSDTYVNGNLVVAQSLNGVDFAASESGMLLTDTITNNSLRVTSDVTLDQNLSRASTPTFAGINISNLNTSTLNLSALTNQLVLNSGGITGTISWAPTGSAKTITLPDATTTLIGTSTTDTLSNKTIKAGDSNTISGSYPDITGITSLGTVSTGTWNGTTIATGYGGTGITSYTKGDILYSSATDTLAKLGIGTTGQVLTITDGVPTWEDAAGGDGSVPSINSLTGALTIAGGGINSISASGTTITVTGTEADTLASVTGRGATTNTAVTFSSTINSNTFSSTALTFAGASPAISASTIGTNITLNAGTTGKVLIGGTSSGDIELGGGSTDFGCTVNNATGDLTCTGDIGGGSTGNNGFWNRTGTTLSPVNSGDSITTAGGISTSGTGILSIAGAATFSSTVNSNTFTSTALTFAGSDPVISGLSSGSNTISLNSAANGSVLLAGGSGSTGCTISDATGNLTCSGSISSTGSSDVGFWSRNSDTSTLSPVTSDDHVSTTGNISTTGTGTITSAGLLTGQSGLTVSGAAVSLNASSNYNTNINTGNSTGAISIGNSQAGAITLQSNAASTFHAPANTATAFRLTDGTNAYQTLDTRNTLSGVSAFSFTAGTAPTIASASNAEYTTLTSTPPTITLTGTTQVTSQMDSHIFNAPTITDSSAITVDKAATMTVAGAPISGATGLATLTDSYALKINSASVDSGTGTVTNAYGLYIDAPTGASTNNYMASFNSANTSGTDFKISNTGVMAGTVTSMIADSLTSGTLLDLSADALAGGKVINLTSTSTGLTTGNLLNLDWSPTGSTNIYATGDLVSIGTGNAYAFVGNLLNVKSQGSSVFSVSDTAVTASIPAAFNAPGDVAIAYDINMTNPTASYIKSNAPLVLQAGKVFNSSDLTLKTYNQGSVVVDQQNNPTAAATSYALQVLPTLTSSTNSMTYTALYGTYTVPIVNLSGDAATDLTTAYGNYTGLTATAGTIGTWYGNYIAAPTGSGTVSTSYGMAVAALSNATSTGLDIGALSGTAANKGINIGAISGTGTGAGLTIGNISSTGANNYGLNLGTLTGGTSGNYQINAGNITAIASATNAGINLGTISGTAASSSNYGVKVGAISSTGTLNTGLDIGALSGATTTNTGINIGNISAATGNNYGINIGTLTGGTGSSVYGINSGTLTSVASGTNFQANFGAVAGADSATFGAIQTGAISGAGTASYGINVGANSSTATTNYGMNVGAISGAGTNNYGINIGAVSGAGTGNYALVTNGGQVSITDSSNTTASLVLTNNTATTVGNGANTLGVIDLQSTSLTTGNFLNLELNALSSGKGLNLTSTSTALSSGNLASFDWSPTGSTNIYATGDLVSIGTGNAYAFVGNLLNVKSQGSSVFSVSDTAVTASIPAAFNAPGDVAIAYDINMTNPTASYIKSQAPLSIEAGEIFNSSDLTLRTYNQGGVVLDQQNNPTVAATSYALQILPTLTSSTNSLTYTAMYGSYTVPSVNLSGNAATDLTTAYGNYTGLTATAGTIGTWYGNYIAAPTGSGTVTNKYALVTEASAGNVGIGTTTPTHLLEISDATASGYIGHFFNDGNDANRYGIQVQAGADDATGTTYYLNALDGDGGQVGYIANTDGTFALTDPSDIRLKTNITDTAFNGLDITNQLRVVDFNRISNPDGRKITGFIAQEVQSIFPNMVNVGPDGMLGVSKETLIPILVKSIQEQQVQIDTLAVATTVTTPSIPTLSDLTSEIASLSARLAKLESSSNPATASPSSVVRLGESTSSGVASSSASLAYADVLGLNTVLESTPSASFSSTLNPVPYTLTDATISGTLKSLGQTYLGNTTIAGDFSIDGTMAISGNSLSSVGTLSIQNGPLAELVDFFNGKVTVDKEGTINIAKLSVTSTKDTTSTKDPTIGSGKILTGQTSIFIPNNQVTTNSKIFTTLRSSSSGQAPYIKNILPGQGFTVSLDYALTWDLNFDWWIIETK